MYIVKVLLLNLVVVIAPLLLYHLFWTDRVKAVEDVVNKRLITVMSLLAVILCICTSFELLPGIYFDLRGIPLAVCILYAGFRPSLVVAASLVVYRLSLGQLTICLFMTIPLIIIIFLLVSQFKPLLIQQSMKRNILAAAALGLLMGSTISCMVYVTGGLAGIEPSLYFWDFFALYSLIHGVTLCLIIYIIEQIKINLRLRNQILQSDKLHLISELAASFAHEIRNPMTVARGFTQILRQSVTTEEKRQIYSEMILDELDKAQSIITNYLAFAKPHLEVNELLDAQLLIQEALQSIKAYAAIRQVEIELELEPKLFIKANKDKFIQCIIHLCSNGIEAMPHGGKLQVIGTIQNQNVCIDITDHGIGMSVEEIRRLGTPFYSTREKGTGLGMMVTYRFIQTLNGKIDVTSVVGKGTCFSLLLPSLHNTSFH